MGISYAFQQPVRFKGVTVLDLIRLASGKNLTAAGACEYLSAVGLCAKDYINREVNDSLSGGEMKRPLWPEEQKCPYLMNRKQELTCGASRI